MEIELNERVISRATDPDGEKKLITKEEIFAHYNDLKNRLKTNIKKKIFYKVESIRILKEIKDNEYYKLDGYKSFDAFIKDYKLAKSQTYEYLKIASAIENGVIEELFLLENGIKETIIFLRNSNSDTVKKSKQNPIKPLRFQLKNQESYDFYKSNSRFVSFMMDEIFKNQKDFLNKLLKRYKESKGQ